MPTYILLSSLTPEGSQTLHKDPDRLDAVNKEISEFGCKVVTQYAVLGGYDFLTIVDAPDNETVAHMSVVTWHGQDHDVTCDSGCPAESQAKEP